MRPTEAIEANPWTNLAQQADWLAQQNVTPGQLKALHGVVDWATAQAEATT